MAKCPSCEEYFDSYEKLASHFTFLAEKSDAEHVMWLNRNITKEKEDERYLPQLLHDFFNVEDIGLKKWIKKRFVKKFYSSKPHPFVLALQHPSRGVLLGYVLEHQHFLKQWVRSLAWIIAKTDREDVVSYELDNIATEFLGYGPDLPSHYELLIRMGESLGLDREAILASPPLPDSALAIKTWQKIGQERHWVEIMAAMHSLELIANRNIKEDGAAMTYFDPSILQYSEITEATKAFLKEGYEADVEHSDVALELVEKYANLFGIVEDVEVAFLKSIEDFDRYLMARLQRAMEFDRTVVSYAIAGMTK